MKTALVTITTGLNYEKLAKITHPTLLAYALKIGADFLVWRDTDGHEIPAYKKLDISKLLEKYERVLYVDTDILIRDDAPNLFEMVPETHVGLFNEGAFQDRRSAMAQFANRENPQDVAWVNAGTYYNTGVMVVSKIHANMFIPPVEEINNFMEQTWLNRMLYKSGHPVFQLPHRCNRMIWLDQSGENRLDSYFLHYAGILSNGIDQLNQVKDDLAQWNADRERGYLYPRKIHFTVRGGFGDQVCAEPVLRYVKETIFKNDKVMVHSDFHELFEHLDVELHKFGEVVNSYGTHLIDVTPRTDGQDANFSLMHQIDFASIKTFGGILPIEKKVLGIKDFSEFAPEYISSKTVLIHASKWWPTKTFPEEFWKMVASEAAAFGFVPIFIGKTSEDGGPSVFDFKGHYGSIVDETDTKALIGAIQKAGYLITTDSAPLHLAGASKMCKVGLVSPIRAPWTLLPYRAPGAPSAEVLCVGEPWTVPDFSPNSIESVRLDDPKFVEAVHASLPTREQIRAFLNNHKS